MEWYKVTSKIKPNDIETEISTSYNYIRKNIIEKSIKDETTGNIDKIFEYDECKILKENWDIVLDIISLTPYKETKTVYYGESEKVFYDVPQGNITVFWDNYAGDYAIERIADRIVVSFDALTDNATISIMIQ